MYIQYIQGLFQSRLGTADYALVTSSLHYHEDREVYRHSLYKHIHTYIQKDVYIRVYEYKYIHAHKERCRYLYMININVYVQCTCTHTILHRL
jgi:hypothetical protein